MGTMEKNKKNQQWLEWTLGWNEKKKERGRNIFLTSLNADVVHLTRN